MNSDRAEMEASNRVKVAIACLFVLFETVTQARLYVLLETATVHHISGKLT